MFDVKEGAIEMLVHKGERHWELMTYNQHPLQHDSYEIFNTKCANKHGRTEEEIEHARAFVKDFDSACESRREKLGLEPYQELGLDDITAIRHEMMKKERGEAGSKFYVRPQAEKDATFDEENPRRVSWFN
jgi:hypothetical protein